MKKKPQMHPMGGLTQKEDMRRLAEGLANRVIEQKAWEMAREVLAAAKSRALNKGDVA